jgi:hypothetical protein
MAEQPKRRERRQVNVNVSQDKRQSPAERRRCPDCGGTLGASVKRVAGGNVRVVSCASCGWTQSARSTDADVLLLKLTWALDLQFKNGQLNAVLPPELTEALKLRGSDQLLLSPLTSPVGSLPMKWALSVKRGKAAKT